MQAEEPPGSIQFFESHLVAPRAGIMEMKGSAPLCSSFFIISRGVQQ
jgi:hypothetical protein